jgi:hypothetical protein
MFRFTLPRDLYHGKGSLEALKTLTVWSTVLPRRILRTIQLFLTQSSHAAMKNPNAVFCTAFVFYVVYILIIRH